MCIRDRRWAEVEAYARRRTAVPSEAFAEHNIANAVARLDETGDLWSGKAWNPAELARALDRARKAWR